MYKNIEVDIDNLIGFNIIDPDNGVYRLLSNNEYPLYGEYYRYIYNNGSKSKLYFVYLYDILGFRCSDGTTTTNILLNDLNKDINVNKYKIEVLDNTSYKVVLWKRGNIYDDSDYIIDNGNKIYWRSVVD